MELGGSPAQRVLSVLTTKWNQLQCGSSRFGRAVEDSNVPLYWLDVEGGLEGY